MDTEKARKVLKSLARQKGISVDTIRREIEIAIELASQNPDPEARAFWLTIPCEGSRPTPEEVISYIAGIAQNQILS